MILIKLESEVLVLPATTEEATEMGLCADYDPPSDPDGGCLTIPDKAHCFLMCESQGNCPFLD